MSQYLITGTSRGIGLELTRQLLAAGQSVVAAARDPESAAGLKALQRDYSKTLKLVKLDVSNEQSIAELPAQLKDLAVIDVLINNAGVFNGPSNPSRESPSFGQTPVSDLREVFETNAVGPFLVTRALLPWLQKSKQASVAHITSLMGSIADNSSGGYYAYRMSKAALNMFNKSFSKDHPQITSVVLHPGWVRTDMGGPSATLAVEDSARGLLNVIASLNASNSGHFYDYSGRELKW